MNEIQFNHIIKRDGSIVPFTSIRITNAIYRAAIAAGERDRAMAEALTKRVLQLMKSEIKSDTPSVEEAQDIIEKVLIEAGQVKISKAFILYRDERARKRVKRDKIDPNSINPRQSENIPWKKIWSVLNLSIDHHVATVNQLNERIADGSFPDLIRECEEAYQLDIARAADAILKRRDEVKFVIVAGPSSSGKTTTTIKIAEHLRNEGFEFIPYHVDNYFHNLEDHPKDEFGDYDYETPDAMDLELLNKHLNEIYEGKEVHPPFFNFKSGKREGTTHPIKLKKGQMLLIDTLHGLYEPLTKGIPHESKFKLYIETLLQMRGVDGNYIRWTDIRLLRRMTRDFQNRNVSYSGTLDHWHYVRRSELRYIIPYVNAVDYIVNGALPYELPFWSARLKSIFEEWGKTIPKDTPKQDSLNRATRVYNLLASITPWTDESVVPSKALLREFIGDSEYKY